MLLPCWMGKHQAELAFPVNHKKDPGFVLKADYERGSARTM